jgi:hypothetical protein
MKFENGVYTHSTLEDGYDFFVKDKWKKKYHFKIWSFPVANGFYSEAREIIGDEKGREPYIFAVLSEDDLESENGEILLKAKIVKGINKRFLTERHGRLEIEDMELRGRIDWTDDLSDTNIDYILAIDGKRITFEKLADMLQGVEGFNFRFTIHDISDEDPD